MSLGDRVVLPRRTITDKTSRDLAGSSVTALREPWAVGGCAGLLQEKDGSQGAPAGGVTLLTGWAHAPQPPRCPAEPPALGQLQTQDGSRTGPAARPHRARGHRRLEADPRGPGERLGRHSFGLGDGAAVGDTDLPAPQTVQRQRLEPSSLDSTPRLSAPGGRPVCCRGG